MFPWKLHETLLILGRETCVSHISIQTVLNSFVTSYNQEYVIIETGEQMPVAENNHHTIESGSRTALYNLGLKLTSWTYYVTCLVKQNKYY